MRVYEGSPLPDDHCTIVVAEVNRSIIFKKIGKICLLSDCILFSIYFLYINHFYKI